MDNFTDERDLALLDEDRYTFFVLKRLLGGTNTLLLSDHARLIICFSSEPFPVWIWTPDDASEEELERAYVICKENGLMDGAHRFNIKYEPADYFTKRAVADGVTFTIETNMFAYDNPEPIAPKDVCAGSLHQCTADDVDALVELMDMFHHAIDMDYETLEEYRIKAEDGVKHGSLYVWKDASGKTVSCCNWRPTGEMAAIGLVFTREEERRKHYAENLVYQVTMIAKNAGFLPMLYTDADYVASNACYEKIGYILRGKLCTIAPQ
ncbi:MAG: GNAT family N-acetyltransferase [Lachnospiraceae bacterium]|nr:GNAT family N-acetyltransferase [Lachnospiraceae bacterium]